MDFWQRFVTPPLDLPKVIEIEPTLSCNLRCRMCHVSFMPDGPRPVLQANLIDKLSCLRRVHAIIGSGFEPMMHRQFATIIRKLSAFDAQIELITNGTLIKDANLDALLDADVRIFNFSFDGIRRETYEHIRRNADHTETLEAILNAKSRFSGRETFFCVNSTMMRSNMAEIEEIVDFWESADFDLVRFIFMVIRENEPELIRESLYPVKEQFYAMLDSAAERVIAKRRKIALRSPWFRKSSLTNRYPRNVRGDVVISDNQRARTVPTPRQDHQLGAGPHMSFPCKSPWTFARIFPTGDVQLCYQFSVGNLRDNSFEEIWFGECANAVRKRVAKEMHICRSCDYFRFCLSSQSVDCDDLESYFAGSLLKQAAQVDFDSGLLITIPGASRAAVR